MTVNMRFQSVELSLLEIADIADAQGGLLDLKIHGKQATQRWLTDGCSDFYHSVVIAQREDLVVRLSVMRREHEARQRDIELVAHQEWEMLDVGVPKEA